jgi:prepilin-type N-terminal cleavage/methylation domain-containing protein
MQRQYPHYRTNYVTSNKRAFTLIEVMVALTLLGLIATLLVSGTRLTLDLSARGNRKTDELRAAQVGRRILRAQLAGALPYRYWTQEQNARIGHVGFDGDASGLRLISRDGVLDGPGGFPRWVDIRRDESSGRKLRDIRSRCRRASNSFTRQRAERRGNRSSRSTELR